RRLGRYPGDWIWASLLLLLVAAGSATAGIVAARDTETANGAKTIVATSPVGGADGDHEGDGAVAAAAAAAESLRADRLAGSRRLHGRPRLDPGARHGPGRRRGEGEGRPSARPARRRNPHLRPVRVASPRLPRRLRRRLRHARRGADGCATGAVPLPERVRTRDHALRRCKGPAARAERRGLPRRRQLAVMTTRSPTL